MFDTLLPVHAMKARALLAPRLQQGLRLLHLPEPEFAQLLWQVATLNPFLDLEPCEEPQAQDLSLTAGDADACEPPRWDAPGRGSASRLDPQDVLEGFAAPVTLADHLRQQVTCQRLGSRERAQALALVDCLDDDGYLRLPLAEAVDSAGLWPPTAAGEALLALRRVQGLEPRGVGARDLRECLLLQLRDLPPGEEDVEAGVRTLAWRLVDRHLRDLAAGDLTGLSRRLDAPVMLVREAFAQVRSLDPRPGWKFEGVRVPARVPDAIVRWRLDRWRVQLLSEGTVQARVNDDCARRLALLPPGADVPARAALASQLAEARFWVRQARQRQDTILAVAEAITRRQARFLRFGPPALRPMRLREIAQDLGLHESTVSRATHGKCLDTPFGIFELKYFFSRPLATARGGDCSPAAVRCVLRELIAAECAAAPLSDGALAEALAAQGLPIARRTVTKYRQQLRIEPAGRRHPAGLRLESSLHRPDAAYPIHRRHVPGDPVGRGRTGAQPDAGVAEHAPGVLGADPDLHGDDLGPGA